MSTETVTARRVSFDPDELARDIEKADQIAQLMDAKFGVGGVRFGLDTLVGLIPVVGDTINTIIGVYPILVAKKHGLGKVVIARMALNLGLDWAAGLTPVIGDAADTLIKIHIKNVALLKQAARKKRGWQPSQSLT